jgi:hypothetical protein
MDVLGTKYGCWFLPKDIDLDEDSVVYSAGVGEDISFDMLLSDKYKCNIVLIDPTKRSKKHFDELKHYYEKIKWKLSGDIQEDYYGIMYPLKPDLDKFTFVEKGLWDKKEPNMKFYKPVNKQYVSHSLLEGVCSDEYTEVDVDTLRNIMDENNHYTIDVLKLKIQGAEVKVLQDMLNENIFPRYICIHFTIVKSNPNIRDEITKILTRLQMLRYKVLGSNSNKFILKLNV